MDNTNDFPKYACQFCGSDQKLVETIIDDEFVWNEYESRFEANKFSVEFEHTGDERCVMCGKDWSGLREKS